jgi:hypothetical protein
METNLNENFEHKIERSAVLDDEFYLKEYFLIIKASNLEGHYQQKLGILIIAIFLLTGLLNVMICTQNGLPKYFCINLDDWEDTDQYDSYKHNTRYKLIHDEMCIITYCEMKEELNWGIGGTIEDSLRLYNRYFPQLLIVDTESYYNIYTYFGLFCDDDRLNFRNNMIRHIYFGCLLGYCLFPIISEYIGRQYSLTLILSMLITCNIIFISFPIKLEIFLILLVIYSTGLYFITLSDIICLETMTAELQKTVTMKRHMYYFLFSLGFTIFAHRYPDFTIISYINIVLCVIALVCSYKSIKETPKYLLERKHFLKLRNNITKISKINNTYDYNVKEMFRKIDKQKRFSKEMLRVDMDLLTIKRENQKFTIKMLINILSLKFIHACQNFVFFIPIVLMYLSLVFTITYIMFHLDSYTDCLIFFTAGFVIYFYSNLRPEPYEKSIIFKLKIFISILFAVIALIFNIYSYLGTIPAEQGSMLMYTRQGLFLLILLLIHTNRKNLDYFVKLSICSFENKEFVSSRYTINDIHIVLYISNSIMMMGSGFIAKLNLPIYTLFAYLFYLSSLISMIYLKQLKDI